MHRMQDLIDKAQGTNQRELGKKPRGVNPPTNFYYYKDRQYSIRQLAEMAGIHIGTMRARLVAGWSIEDAMQKSLQKKFSSAKVSS